MGAFLRNTIGRAFWVLKNKFPIIRSTIELTYGVRTQKKKLSCCILQNYLMGVNLDDRLLNEVGEEILNNPDPHDEHGAQRDRDNEDATRG